MRKIVSAKRFDFRGIATCLLEYAFEEHGVEGGVELAHKFAFALGPAGY